MVLLNTQPKQSVTEQLKFNYCVEISESDCIFCSAKDRSTGKLKLYLISRADDRVYKRRPLTDSWIEVDERERDTVTAVYYDAVRNNVPYYRNRFSIQ